MDETGKRAGERAVTQSPRTDHSEMSSPDTSPDLSAGPRQGARRRFAWLTSGVLAIGLASFFSDLGHEMTTALLPAFLVGTLGAPAAALGIIEGVADGASALLRFTGGYASDAASNSTRGRRVLGAGGYLATALATGLIGLATSWPIVAALRSVAWMGRGFRSPIRNAVLADQVDKAAYGRAFGFERAMDSMGAIVGPLIASGLFLAIGMRPTLLLAAVPGLVAVVLFFVVREERHSAIARTARSVWGALGALPTTFRRFLLSAGVFGLGNFAATFLILRATTLLAGPYGAVQGGTLAIGLYTLYNIVYALSAYGTGELADRAPKRVIVGIGYALFLLACLGFIWVGPDLVALAVLFSVAGAHVGCIETAETAYAAETLPADLRGTGFGTLAAVNGIGDTLSSITVGVLWTAIAPAAGFAFGAVCAFLGLATLIGLARR